MIKDVEEKFPHMLDPRFSNHWGPGWHSTLLNMFAQLNQLGVRCSQVKEKLGDLRVYIETDPAPSVENYAHAHKLINEYEKIISNLCYECGAKGATTVRVGWAVITLCKSCADDRVDT